MARKPVEGLSAAPAIRSGRGALAKRAIDFVVSAWLLLALAPLMIVLALIVAASSPGGSLFVQERAGRGERFFRMYKFRTMVANAAALQPALEPLNELDGAVFAIGSDPRATRLGRLLRRASLDELPQLVNVLKGDMSLVGPRPLPRRDHLLLRERDKVRYSVRPGMTGLAQVCGRNGLSFAEMMSLDARYAREWSLLGDLKILLRTPRAVLTGAGAS